MEKLNLSIDRNALKKQLDNFNDYIENKYKRGVFRYDFTLSDIIRNPRLIMSLKNYTKVEQLRNKLEHIYQKRTAEIMNNDINNSEIISYSDDNVENITNLLLNGNLVAIPNGCIYVLFGLQQINNDIKKKINTTKTRNEKQPLAKLVSPESLPLESNKNINETILLDIIAKFYPIGILMNNELFIIYNNSFFNRLFTSLNNKIQNPTLYVSSANTSTTGSNVTLNDTKIDLEWKGVKYFINGDDINKTNSNSTTIILFEDKLSFYRVGSPKPEEINEFISKKYGEKHTISMTPSTRISEIFE